ncbi:MAG: site-2 protease family protein, partial [Planctomycetes bacterium]|nr:site-2 protease family protein [Planctomycetota bacterium]
AVAKIHWRLPAGGSSSAPAAAGGQAAVTVGLRPGDRITRIEGDSAILAILGNDVHRFDRLALTSVLARRDDKFKVTVRRDANGTTLVGTAELGVKMAAGRSGGRRLSFGIEPAADVVVKHGLDYRSSAEVDPFREGDRVLAVAGRKVRYTWQIEPVLEGLEGLEVPVEVARGGEVVRVSAPRGIQTKDNVLILPDGTHLDADDFSITEDADGNVVLTDLADGSRRRLAKDELVIPRAAQILDILGMAPRLRITGIVPGSPADEAGLAPGDIIVHYGDTDLPTVGQLLDVSRKASEAGTLIVVERHGRRLAPIRIVPRVEKGRALIGVCRYLDFAHPVVAGVRKGSPADRAGIRPGFVIEKVNSRKVSNWLEIFDALRAAAGEDVTLTCRRSSRRDSGPVVVSIGRLGRDVFDPGEYEMTIFPGPQEGFLEPLQVVIRKDSLPAAIGWSLRETAGFMISTYVSLRALVTRTVSTKDVMGPVGLSTIAVKAARIDIMHLVYVLAFLSAVLAVMNFLPFPVLDGGHAVLLIIEKIRGKPTPARVMNILQLGGLIVIGLLFLAITWQDILRLLG